MTRPFGHWSGIEADDESERFGSLVAARSSRAIDLHTSRAAMSVDALKDAAGIQADVVQVLASEG